MTPIKAELSSTAQRYGWEREQVYANVDRFHRFDAVLTVTYTSGGHLSVQAAHYQQGPENWWLHNKTARKRETVIELLERTP